MYVIQLAYHLFFRMHTFKVKTLLWSKGSQSLLSDFNSERLNHFNFWVDTVLIVYPFYENFPLCDAKLM